MYKIVLCEEDLLMRQLIALVLESGPWELRFTQESSEGLGCIEREQPDLVFIDVARAEFNGIEL
jgi:CheY-like chemotaxis protein